MFSPAASLSSAFGNARTPPSVICARGTRAGPAQPSSQLGGGLDVAVGAVDDDHPRPSMRGRRSTVVRRAAYLLRVLRTDAAPDQSAVRAQAGLARARPECLLPWTREKDPRPRGST